MVIICLSACDLFLEMLEMITENDSYDRKNISRCYVDKVMVQYKPKIFVE